MGAMSGGGGIVVELLLLLLLLRRQHVRGDLGEGDCALPVGGGDMGGGFGDGALCAGGRLQGVAGLGRPCALEMIATTAAAEGLFLVALLLATATGEAACPAADDGHGPHGVCVHCAGLCCVV